MEQRRVGIRELKSKLSEFMREVKGGSTIVVTEHGRGVARLVPELHSLEQRMQTLRDAGIIFWSGRRLRRSRPEVRARGKRTVSDIVVENRQ